VAKLLARHARLSMSPSLMPDSSGWRSRARGASSSRSTATSGSTARAGVRSSRRSCRSHPDAAADLPPRTRPVGGLPSIGPRVCVAVGRSGWLRAARPRRTPAQRPGPRRSHRFRRGPGGPGRPMDDVSRQGMERPRTSRESSCAFSESVSASDTLSCQAPIHEGTSRGCRASSRSQDTEGAETPSGRARLHGAPIGDGLSTEIADARTGRRTASNSAAWLRRTSFRGERRSAGSNSNRRRGSRPGVRPIGAARARRRGAT